MRSTILAIIATAFLSGCAGSFAAPGTAIKVPFPTVKTAKPAKPKLSSRDIICQWAKTAGIPDVKLGMFDRRKTVRSVGGVLASYEATCKGWVAKPVPDA